MNKPFTSILNRVPLDGYGGGAGSGAVLSPPPPIARTRPTTPSPTVACREDVRVAAEAYRAEIDMGKGVLDGGSHCIAIGLGTRGAIIGRWTWNQPGAGEQVKAHPKVVFGQTPGQRTTTPVLPKKISRIGRAVVAYDLASTHRGSGNTAFALWLTDTANPSTFATPPVTHRLTIWLESYGGMQPAGTFVEQTAIDDALFDVIVGDGCGAGWRSIAFRCIEPRLGARSLDLAAFLHHVRSRNLATGDEYLASVELGNEVLSGTGETVLKAYAVSVQ